MRILIKWYSEIIITKAQIFFPITVLLKAMEIVHTLHTLVQDAIWVSLTTLSLFHHLYIIDFNVTSTGSCHKLSVTKKLVGKASHNWKEIALDSFPHCTKVYSNGINVMKWAVSRSVCLWSPEMALHWGERFGSLFILIAVQNFTGINIHHYTWCNVKSDSLDSTWLFFLLWKEIVCSRWSTITVHTFFGKKTKLLEFETALLQDYIHETPMTIYVIVD
jgi:hypothetical protein